MKDYFMHALSFLIPSCIRTEPELDPRFGHLSPVHGAILWESGTRLELITQSGK